MSALFFMEVSPARAADLWPDLSSPPKGLGGGEKDAAIIVGIENYAFVAKVPGARQNADDWQAYLTDSLKVPSDRVALLRDNEATLEKLRKFAAKKASQVKPGGTLWFVFIGHGATSPDGKDGLLVGADAQQDADGFFARSLARGELLDILAKGRQGKTVVILDACFSGKSPSGEVLVAGLQPLVAASGLRGTIDARTILLTAAKSDQFAGPLPKAERMRPAFSYLALGGLRGWAADVHGKVTASAIVEFSRRALDLEKGRTQTPELSAGTPETVLGIGHQQAPDLGKIDREGTKPVEQGFRVSILPLAPKSSAGGSPISKDIAPDIEPVMNWVQIPGGTFIMGSQNGNPNTRPAHRVVLKTFLLAKTLATNKQYRACVEAGVCAPAHYSDGMCSVPPDWKRGNLATSFQGDDQPVVCVEWNQARIFSQWVGGRLPSESEWEYAARSASKNWKYPWGNRDETCDRAVKGSNGCGRGKTWPVCSRPAGNTEQGLCDMIGNTWEWVQDWYHDSYDGAPIDGSAWEEAADGELITRGGSWNDPLEGLPTLPGSYTTLERFPRENDWQRHISADIGFRPAR